MIEPRELFKHINLALSFGLVFPVLLIISDIYRSMKMMKDKVAGKVFLSIYIVGMVTVLISLLFYSVAVFLPEAGRFLHEISTTRTSIFLIGIWLQTIAFYLARKNKL